MNLLADLLYLSSLLDARYLPEAITLDWLSDNAESEWERALPVVADGVAPSLADIRDSLSTHPLAHFITESYLPLVSYAEWAEDFAAAPDAPVADSPEDWIEFLPSAGREFGVIVPEFSGSEFEVAMFWRPSATALFATGGPPRTVVIGLGPRLRGRRVSVGVAAGGCAPNEHGNCESDGTCADACEKQACRGRLGNDATRCECTGNGAAARAGFIGAAQTESWTERAGALFA